MNRQVVRWRAGGNGWGLGGNVARGMVVVVEVVVEVVGFEESG